MMRSFIFIILLLILQFPSAFCLKLNLHNLSDEDSLKTIEKVYVHIDRDVYYSNDDIWFKAYLIDALSQLLTNHSSNLHVELISPSLDIIYSRIIKLSGGLGYGDFHVSQNLNSGRYTLRAYTNFMRNFEDNIFFNKTLIIINPNDDSKAIPRSGESNSNETEIVFFPEGGSLVDNVSTIVGFKALDSKGLGSEVIGDIYSSSDEIVTSFKSTHNGMGTFSLKPSKWESYYALVKNNAGDFMKYNLPESFAEGVVLGVSKNEIGELSLAIKTNAETFNIYKDNDLTLNVSAHNITYKTFQFRMTTLNNYFSFSMSDLPSGIYSLTLSDPNNINICERLVFNQNEGDLNIKLETDKRVYDKRDSISVKISLPRNTVSGETVFLSLSASNSLFHDSPSSFPTTIASWFLLESEIRGPVEDPSYYFDFSNKDRLKNLDILLLTQGWRDFEKKYKYKNYKPELGFNISGRVRKKFSDTPIKKSVVTVAIFKNGNPFLRSIPTDSSGRFYIENVGLSGESNLIATATGEKDDLKGWLILDSVEYVPAPIIGSIIPKNIIRSNIGNEIQIESINSSKTVQKFIQYAEIQSSIQKKYKLSDTLAPGEVTITAARNDWTESARSRSRHFLMGTPDREVIITPQLEAYSNIHQLVMSRFVSPFKLQGPFTWGLNPNMTNPLCMIDGVKVTIDELRTIPVKWVERIDIMETVASYSAFKTIIQTDDSTSSLIDGVISVILRNDFETYSTPEYHSVNMKFSGYDEPRIFYSPKHFNKLESDYKPDLRTTIYWKPDIIMRSDNDLILNFFNTDVSSSVTIVVEGITSTGIPIVDKVEYLVR